MLAALALVVALPLILTTALVKTSSIESRREEQAEMERWIKMKAAFDAERAQSEDDK